jgi:hypothetical protein
MKTIAHPRAASAEDLLARAAERAAETPAAPLLEEHDQDEKHADEDVDDLEQGGHGAALGRLLTLLLASAPLPWAAVTGVTFFPLSR